MKKMRKGYCVIAHRIDCGDEVVFQIDGKNGKDFFSTKSEARNAMKADYRIMADAYSPEWSADGKTDPCQRRIGKDEIFLNVPIWNGEEKKDDWILCHWKIVEV